MAPKSNVPIRICGSKVRSGCQTCKQRHLKCGEEQPACFRCQKGNRKCVYGASRSQTPQPTLVSDPATQLTMSIVSEYYEYLSCPSLNTHISPYGPREVSEVTAVKYFAINLGKELAGSFSDDVWVNIFPRVAQHEPAVWHALVAVSTLDSVARSHHELRGANPNITLAIRHYGKAMQELHARLAFVESGSGKDVVLLCCILFAVFECLRNHFESALRHITGGRKLLIEWENETPSNEQHDADAYLDRRSLQPIFLSLDSQALQLGVVGFREDLPLPSIDDQLHTPTSVEEAHIALSHIFNRLSHWQQWVEPCPLDDPKPSEEWMMAEKEVLQAQLASWDSAFESIRNHSHLESAPLLLLVQRTAMQIFFNKAEGPTEMEWDKSMPLFRQAVEYAEAYMKLTVDNFQPYVAGDDAHIQHFNMTRPVFTVAMDIVLSLVMICTRCRDSNLRRRGLTMVKICGRKEGIWDSYVLGKLSEKIIALEESCALEDGSIPENARVYGVDIQLSDETGGKLTHKKLVRHEDGSLSVEIVEDTLVW